ncbi:MAG: hypothetical protein Kow0088_20740 [Anaerolineales bacterium]
MLLLICSLAWFWKSGQVANAQLEAASWQTKLDAWVWQTAQGGQTEFLVFLQDQADLSGVERLSNKDEKGWYVYRQLTAVAQRTQAPLLELLRQQGIAHRPYWVANMIWVRGDLNDALMLAWRSDVAHLFANPTVQLDLPIQAESTVSQTENGIEWNLQKVNADKVWAMGYEGQGAVIGGQDTGYDWQHPALKNAYRGWDGSQANHDYNWHDAIHEPITINASPKRGSESPTPLPLGEGLGVSPYSPLPVGEGMG